MDSKKSNSKVLMLPWLAYGHASPYLELSKRLIENNFFIYFCSTPIILSSIKKKLNEKQSLSIQLVEIHLPSSPELPPHHHVTKHIPNNLIFKLQDAFDFAAPSFSLILETLKPNLVIYDVFQPWAAAMSSSHNIPAVPFFITAAAMYSLAYHMIQYPKKEFPFKKITSCFIKNYKSRWGKSSPEKIKKDAAMFFESVKRASEMVLIKSFDELEGEYCDYFSITAEKKIVPVGPLVESLDGNGDEIDEIKMWLDNKNEGSTVFVSFGSECFLSNEEIEEFAHGLEMSSVNFLWAIRFSGGEESKVNAVLPPGFLERIEGRGKVLEGWAPQMKILSHSSIGGFVSHCGWGSVMESMKLGVPIIAVPMHLEQPVNARLVVELGVGVEVEMDEHGEFKRKEIAKAIKMVIVEEDGERVRSKARKFGDTMGSKEEEGVARVVGELSRLCKVEK